MPVLVFAQTTTVNGVVTTEAGIPLEYASVSLKNTQQLTHTNAAGRFTLSIPSGKEASILIRYIGFQEQEVIIKETAQSVINLKIALVSSAQNLAPVIISGTNSANNNTTGSIMRLSPRISKEIPSVFNDFNKVLATLPGVISNNELSSTYSVRGGNYDENLVYVNGIEIYRPFLVSNAQQEGLSFVNPDLVQDIQFSTGGWQPRWGDKLSSVLNIEYKKPRKLAGSVTGGLMGGEFHLENASKNQRATYLLGVRYKNQQLVFRSLETTGNYQPNFLDAQVYINLDLSRNFTANNPPGKTTLGILVSVARNKYRVVPSYRETSFGTTDRIVRLGIQFSGHERMEYETYQGGFNLKHYFKDRFFTELIGSALLTHERELRDIAASYLFYDVSPNGQGRSSNDMVRNVEAGTNLEHARNKLAARVFTLENRYTWQLNGQNNIQLGVKTSREKIADQLKEYALTDSADYITLNQSRASSLNLYSFRHQAYGQHTWQIDSLRTINYGVRANYWTVNQQLVISPRVQLRAKLPNQPAWIFKAAAGYYYQPPFYRELRNQAGELNTNLQAQKSVHVVAGAEHYFRSWSRPFKWTSEIYYKRLSNVIPYEVDNVRLRYFARNNAKAYAVGLDMRVNGDFIKGAESWFSLGIMSTKEDITGDSTIYDLNTFKLIKKEPLGYIRRPTDQRVTFGFYFQDHIPNNPSLKLYLNGVIGTGLPFSPPGNESIRNQYNMPFYRRVDVGFSKLVSFRTIESAKTNPLESLWISLEVLNLIAANNVVSYSYVKDIYNVTYAVPNYLSSRLINLRFIARF
ncbi:TonB-dependent receptor [Adhaeribacter swui]|uniref:TonB-dependent receptor n=1 Tax=Adhaeribacter swui TaxID=2086471 RepID=A0A7G7GD37_9BACT|nr:carboxypeptidase-like regulatory domain-containing protein [Adhaeribacter swui]QNF35071.1 TonB-dependent receptor [Adhaeribacter swui]